MSDPSCAICGVETVFVLSLSLKRWSFCLPLFLGGLYALNAVASEEVPINVPKGTGAINEFIPCEYPEGSLRFIAISESDMPWTVSISRSNRPPKGATREAARRVAIESMDEWATAIRTQLPWFRLEFVEEDPEAAVFFRWKKRSPGQSPGAARPTCGKRKGQLYAGGEIEVVLQACPTCRVMNLDDLRAFVIHQFGHVLGLEDCVACTAAMTDQWRSLGYLSVTQVDVEAAVDWWLKDQGARRHVWSHPTTDATAPPSPIPSAAEAAERDRKKAAEWERRKSERLYAETPGGGFVVVDGWRLRLGPESGERWYTFEEMTAIKSERQAVGSSP